MYCIQCKNELAAGAKFCSECGAKVEPAASPNVAQQVGQVTGGVVAGMIQAETVNITTGETPRTPPELRRAYLNRVVDGARYLSLSGIDPKAASQAGERLSLEAVYTALLTLSTDEHARLERGISADVGAMLPSPKVGRGAGGEGETRRLSALEQLDRQARLVLLGDPGSGKSTFASFVALCLAGEALQRDDVNLALLTAPLSPEGEDQQEEEPKPQPWRHAALLPVCVTLRDFAAGGLPDRGKGAARHLWDFIVAGLEAASLGDYAAILRRELLEQGGLLLLDGLDEVPEAEQRRERLKECVEDFARTFGRCRILVTSRTYAYQKQDWRLQGFSETVLAPFSRGQIARFVDGWYRHIAALRHMGDQDAQGRAELLKRAIFNSDRLAGLAERPLLLTLMASLHAWRGGSLPEKREELYSDTVDLLLDWWESPKLVRDAAGQPLVIQPSLAEYLKVERGKLRGLLNRLAFQAHAAQPELSGTADVPRDDLLKGLMDLTTNPDVKPARLEEYLSDRAGLLLPRGVGVYTFPHRTFQEYLAACYLTVHDYPDQAAELACCDPNRWREALLLAGAKAGRGAPAAVWLLADALCFREVGQVTAAGEGLAAQWGALLAGQALAESANLEAVSERDRPKLARARGWLVEILRRGELPAVERALAGDALAALGDPRFDAARWHLPAEACLGFVRIPAGKFWMGSDRRKDKRADDDELPQLEVSLGEYYLGRYPVTAAQFAAFVKDGGYARECYWPEAKAAGVWKNGAVKGRFDQEPRCAPEDFGQPYNLPNHPVVGVTWYEALAYCRWLGEQLSAISHQRLAEVELAEAEQAFWEGLASGRLRVALPSEAEWEKAARGALTPGPSPKIGRGGNIYPWGDEFDPDKANTVETGIGTTSAVGCFPRGASPYGLLDMSGNAWEWTRSLWREEDQPIYQYSYNSLDGRENLEAGYGSPRFQRGGDFGGFDWHARCAGRLRYLPSSCYGRNVGFRAGVSLLPMGSGVSGTLGL